jgi:hypothetical protein
MRPIGVALVLVLVAVSSAHADGPIVVRAGLGITRDLDLDDVHNSSYSRIAHPYGPGFSLDIGYRFIDQLAAGVHFGVTRNSATESGGNVITTYTYHFVYTPMQLGVGAQFSVSRFWLAPWVGVNDGITSEAERHVAFGFGVGADLYISPTRHRVGAYLDVSDGVRPDTVYQEKHRYVSAGIAYRYW